MRIFSPLVRLNCAIANAKLRKTNEEHLAEKIFVLASLIDKKRVEHFTRQALLTQVASVRSSKIYDEFELTCQVFFSVEEFSAKYFRKN